MATTATAPAGEGATNSCSIRTLLPGAGAWNFSYCSCVLQDHDCRKSELHITPPLRTSKHRVSSTA
eukprot:6196735-Pleurochrysis_carterae.AAC.1